MRVFVISDSHGDMEAIKKAVRLAGDFDRIFHLGDNYRDALKLAEYTGIAVDAVAGNCDFVDAPSSSVVVLRGKRFFLVPVFGVRARKVLVVWHRTDLLACVKAQHMQRKFAVLQPLSPRRKNRKKPSAGYPAAAGPVSGHWTG